MRVWYLWCFVYAISAVAGVLLNVFLMEGELFELWEARNRLFPASRSGLFSGALSIAQLIFLASSIVLFYRKSMWAPPVFGAQVAVAILSVLFFGPSISSQWSTVLSYVYFLCGTYMTTLIMHRVEIK